MRAITITCLTVLPLLGLLSGCVNKDDDAFSTAYEAGCFDGDDDGFKDGYANGYSCADNHYEQYDEYAAAIGDHPRPDCESDGCAYYEDWVQGYAQCYGDSYEEGLGDGAQDAACN